MAAKATTQLSDATEIAPAVRTSGTATRTRAAAATGADGSGAVRSRGSPLSPAKSAHPSSIASKPSSPPSATSTSTSSSLLSPNPDKRAAELFLLAYTPVWMAVTAVVMVGGLATHWHDAELGALGGALHAGNFVGLVVWPALRSPQKRRLVLLLQSFGLKLHVWLVLFAYGGNWAFTRYFYEVLGMSYAFPVTVFWNNVPAFLYPMTVAYFGTYYVFVTVVLRAGRAAFPAGDRAVRATVYLLATLANAFLETALNANPFIRNLFCYEDLPFMLWFGTLMYGSYFAIAGWVWLGMAERPGATVSWAYVLGSFAACFLAMMAANELFARALAPAFIDVRWGRVGLHAVGESCLQPL